MESQTGYSTFRVAGTGSGVLRPAVPRPQTRSPYALRFAETQEDREAAFRLRFRVFNLELNEGLTSAYWNGCDTDEFDDVYDHLIVEHSPTAEVIGTYRLQTGKTAEQNLGYYSEREFDFSPYANLRHEMVELGRAAIRNDHRSFEVLNLLWRGIAEYALARRARYLIGCSSLTSQAPKEGSEMFRALQSALVEPSLRTKPHSEFALPVQAQGPSTGRAKPPKLLLAYLALGARICGEPAIDREFKTIDFLTLLDLERLSPAARARFLF